MAAVHTVQSSAAWVSCHPPPLTVPIQRAGNAMWDKIVYTGLSRLTMSGRMQAST